MEVEVLKDGKTAKDKEGNIYKIDGISLTRQNRSGSDEPIYYDNKSRFFKVACPSGTFHEVRTEKNGVVVLM